MVSASIIQRVDSDCVFVCPLSKNQVKYSNKILPSGRLVYIINKKWTRITEILCADGRRTLFELYRDAKWYRRLFMRKDYYVLQQEDFR